MKKDFLDFADMMQKYLETKKTLTINKERFADMQIMFRIAHKLFPDMNIRFEDDPLQLGRLILCISGNDFDISGEENIRLFAELIFNADNFEICTNEEGVVDLNIMYGDVFDVKIK